jgi:acetyl esterase/lipase
MILVLAAALLLLALTTVFISPYVTLWQLSILATEFGHWFAALSIVVAVIVWKKYAGVLSWVGVAALGVALFLFSRPYVQASLNENIWRQELNAQLNVTAPSLVSFKSLWWAGHQKFVKPETVVYEAAPESLSFDFYRAESSKPAPWVIVVHGGGWDSGSPEQLTELNSHLARRGISVASIRYRLAPRWRWPAQRDDVYAAAEYIKAHAKELNIDPKRWALLGRSAGGQIAQSAAYLKPDVTLKGVIAYYSPADMEFAYVHTKDNDIINSRVLISNLMGGKPADAPAAYRDASPIQFVRADAPPTLLLHGRPDPLTWYIQSRRLYDAIEKVKGRAAYIEMPWATHAFDYSLNGPGGQVATNAVDGFLETVFKTAVIPAKAGIQS